MGDLLQQIQAAAAAGHLLESTVHNLAQTLEQSSSPVSEKAIAELVAGASWDELNDRFFKTLAFGTGGLRGRTIGKIVTEAEQGEPRPLGRPQRPCVGTNAMNYYNISRATQGLVAYLKEWFAKNELPGRPKIAIAHDTRHFSRDFTELTASVGDGEWAGCLPLRRRRARRRSFPSPCAADGHAGIVITASHNPPHDNGYKVYFGDGAQVVEPHASGIIAKVNAIEGDVYEPLPGSEQGRITVLGKENDEAYMARLETLILDRAMVAAARSGLKIVFTSIHGTGGTIIKPMLERLGFRYSTVAAQEVPDGRFPTVKSPNPENAEALAMAIALAKEEGADLVIATDPDCDRMGVAVRNSAAKWNC